jgi:hypothetical protein
MDEPGSDAERLYEALRTDYLSRPGVSLGRALHNETLTVHGKIFAFLKDDHLVVKIPASRAAALVSAGDAERFESGGRPMKEWVSVPAMDQWRQLIADAYAYVGAAR